MPKKHSTRLLFLAGIALVLAAAYFWGWQWVRRVPEPPRAPVPKTDPHGPPARAHKPGVTTRVLRIALIAPQTSLPSGIQPLMNEAARFAIQQINRQGGALGTPIHLIELDNTNSALGSQQAALEAVRQDVSAVIGGWFSSNALAMAKVLQTARIPMITPAASHPDVTRIGDFIFRTHCIDTFQGAAMAEFAYRKLHARSAVVLVNIGNAYSPYLGDVFSHQFRQFGGKVLWRGEFLQDSKNHAKLIRSILERSPDIVYLPAYERESAQIIREARQMGVAAEFLGADGWISDMITYEGELVKGILYTKGWHPQAEQIRGLRDVYEEWSRKNGPIERDVTALTIDACFLLRHAIEAAGSTRPADIRNALARTAGFNGLTGTYSFDENGDPIKPLQILKLTGDIPALIETVYPKQMRLGAVFAKTGDAAATNIMAFEAARYAVDEINKKGGALGYLLQLFEYDNASTALGSRQAALQAVTDRVAAVIGASWSSHSSAMAPVLQENRIPMISPASTNPKVTQVGNYIFRACFTDSLQGRSMAEFAIRELGAKTAMVITNTENTYSVDLARFFIDRFRKSGRVIEELDYLQETNDFTPIVQAVKQAGPDVVFIPGYPRDAAYILKQAHQMGVSTVFLGGDGWDDLMYDYTPHGLDGHFFAEHWHIDIPDARSRQFVSEYSRTHDKYRTGLIALTYDAVCLIADAIRRAGVIDPEKIRDALARTRDFAGITGEITYNSQGDPVKPVVILQFQDGTARFHTVLKPAFEKK